MRLQTNPYLALVGMHGYPERTGLTLRPVDGWDIEVANNAAVTAGIRQMRYNMALQFSSEPPTDKTDDNYELWRPTEIKRLTYGREIVLEVHDRPDDVGEYVATGGIYHTRLLGVAALLGIRSVINQGRLPTLSNYAMNNLVVELCRNDAGDSERRIAENEKRLQTCMRTIASGTIPDIDVGDFDYYDYAIEFTQAQAETLGLDRMNLALQPFDPIPSAIIEQLGLPPGDYVAEAWNGVCSGAGEWFGGVLRRMPPPIKFSEPPTARGEATDMKITYSTRDTPAT